MIDMRGRIGAGVASVALSAAVLTGCSTSDGEPVPQPVSAAAEFDEPSALALQPGTPYLWVTNQGDDSITVVDLDDPSAVRHLRDGYGEHFTARPSGISFSENGEFFAVSNDSNNEVRGMDFVLNPERNTHFKGNNFMGPTLFTPITFALAGQNKDYLDDWPQPGISHDPPDDTPQSQCPTEYWSESTSRCVWPRQGSHLDMLHGNPLSTGIVHDEANAYFVLDGCGAHVDNVCSGPGHVARVDFNRDHQEGNGFHGDGVTRRYIDLPYERVDGIPSGMFADNGWVYYSDTGAGVVRRFRPESGHVEVMVANWNDSPASHGEQGPGVIDWSHLEDGPGDGDDPATVEAWVASHGNQELIAAAGDEWIQPMETLAEYSYVWHATVEDAATGISDPSGLAVGEDSWFVAEYETGTIREFARGGEPGRVFETGMTGVTGLVVDTERQALYFADAESNGVYRIDLG